MTAYTVYAVDFFGKPTHTIVRPTRATALATYRAMVAAMEAGDCPDVVEICVYHDDDIIASNHPDWTPPDLPTRRTPAADAARLRLEMRRA